MAAVAPTAPPTTPPAATPRGYAPGDPCAPGPRLCIPALTLTAPIVPVGATVTGAMAAPPDPRTVGSYAPGVVPRGCRQCRERGHGRHADDRTGDPLGPRPARAGDGIVVVDAMGPAWRFVVLENVVYRGEEALLMRIVGPADDANLALLAGAGTWDPALGVYDGTRPLAGALAGQRSPRRVGASPTTGARGPAMCWRATCQVRRRRRARWPGYTAGAPLPGIPQPLGTVGGLFRHYWVLVKLDINPSRPSSCSSIYGPSTPSPASPSPHRSSTETISRCAPNGGHLRDGRTGAARGHRPR